jgi:hypothetical protein
MTVKEFNPRSNTFAILIMATVSVLCFSPVLLWGPPAVSADLTHHVQIANAYFDGFQNGTVLPDWVDVENGGYGSVTVRFYPPLIHVTIALFKLILLRMDWAIFAAFSLWSLIGCWGMFLWARDIAGGTVAPLAGAVLFAISPYHLNQFYNSFMFGEFVSLSALPFAFYFIGRLCKIGGSRNVIGLAVAISALVLSNIPQTVVCFPFLGLYVLLCLDRKRIARQAAMLTISGMLAAACTAFYWVRVVFEMSWIHVSEVNTDPNYDFQNNFLFSSMNAGGGGIVFGSIMLLLLIAMVAALLFTSGRFISILQDRNAIPPLAILILSIFMTVPISRPVWEAFDQLQRVQFPWRFLSVASLAASVIMAYTIAAVDSQSIRENRPVLLIMIGCVLILGTFSVKQVMLGAAFSEPGIFNNKAETSPAAKGLYHWWPIWANKDTFRERTNVIAPGREVSINRWDRDAREFSVSPGETSTVRAAVLYYPWWRATVNGNEVETRDLGGAVSFDIGPESSDCSLSFHEPSYTRISRIVSLIAVLGIFFFLAAKASRAAFFYELHN